MPDTEKAEIIPEAITYTAQIPSTKLEVEGDWPKGTILNINLSLRVRGRVDGEDRKGNETLHHLLAVEEASIQSVLTPAQRKAAYDAALAAQQKVIDEEPGQEDQIEHPGIEAGEGVEHPADGTWSPEVSNEPTELVNELTPETEDWSDVDAQDAQKRQLQVEGVERVEETDAHQYEEVNF
jgi:hypothetical protein